MKENKGQPVDCPSKEFDEGRMLLDEKEDRKKAKEICKKCEHVEWCATRQVISDHDEMETMRFKGKKRKGKVDNWESFKMIK
jgi:hypothetical protein